MNQRSRYCFSFDNAVAEKRFSVLVSNSAINTKYTIEAFKTIGGYFVLVDLKANIDAVVSSRRVVNEVDTKDLVGTSIDFKGLDEPLIPCFQKPKAKQLNTQKYSECKRKVFTLELKHDKDLLACYKNVHQPENIWPKIVENMNAMGILNLEIYLRGYTAFMIMDLPLYFDMEKDGAKWAAMPQEQEWQAYVAKFQRTNPETKALEKWKELERIALK